MKINKKGIILMGVVGSLLFGRNVYAQTYGTVNADILNVRQGPMKESAIVEVYKKDNVVTITSEEINGWYGIKNKNGNTSYVSSEYVDVFKIKAKVNASSVNGRTYPTMTSTVNRQFNKGQEISVFYKVGDWYYVSLNTNDSYSFIHEKYVDGQLLYLLPNKSLADVKEIEFKTPETPKVAKTTKGEEIANYAKQFIGNPYRYGGTSLTKGADCSGFTQQIMKKAGVSLQRSSSAQYSSNGVKVSTNNLQPGDLLFYGYGGKVSHVGVYVGDKKMVHASSSKTGIIMSNAFRTSGKPLIGAKRVI